MSESNLELSLQRIKILLAEKKFKQALEQYEFLNQQYPINSSIRKIKTEILSFMEKENNSQIEKLLKGVEQLFKDEKYEDIIRILSPYFKSSPKNRKLKKAINKAKDLYQDEIHKKQNEFEKNEGSKLKESMKKNVAGFLQDVIALKRKYGENVVANIFIEKAKAYYIHFQIQKNKELIKSNKYDLIASFIKELKEVNDSYMELLDMEKEVNQRKYSTNVLNLSESLYEAEKNVETLLKLKKYDKAYKGSMEIIKADPKNKNAYKFLKKAKAGMFKSTREKTIQIIIQEIPNIKSEYLKNPSNFIKL